jgi:hypothetical protein
MPTIYRNLLESQLRVEEAISDVKMLLRDIATPVSSPETAHSEVVQPWEIEWLNQVQNLLEMDAGWGLRGFWGMVLYNLRVRITPAWKNLADSSAPFDRTLRLRRLFDPLISTCTTRSGRWF